MGNQGLFSSFKNAISKIFVRSPAIVKNTTPQDIQEEKPVVKLDTATGLMVERYYIRGKLHRDWDKPAVIEYEPTSNRVMREQYFQNGKLHRPNNKPAFIEYSAATGKTVLEVFFENGKLHCGTNTPTAIDYDRTTGEPIQYDSKRPGSPPLKRI
jgi:hypothetical protein